MECFELNLTPNLIKKKMNTQTTNQTTKLGKKIAFRSAFGFLLSSAFLLPLADGKAQATIIDAVTEDTSTARVRDYSSAKGGTSCNRLDEVSSPVRAGRRAFLHWINRCGERSELSNKKTVIGNTYWYGWSMYIPGNWQSSDSYDILAQWATYPTPRNGRFACGANGSFMMRGGNSITFKLQHKGDRTDIECDQYTVAQLSEVRDKWVDFVMQAKWTGDSDGFVKMWVKVGNGPYELKVDYKGRTFWNDEGEGPYFKMGLYKGDPNFSGVAPRYMYTDEYRLGDANSGFAAVAPGGSAPVVTPQPPASQGISENFSSSTSNFSVESGGSWQVSGGQYQLRNTASASDASNGNISVHKTSVPTNFTLTADASAVSSSSSWDDFSVIFNYQNRDNYYFASFNESDDDQTNGIFKVVGGVTTQIANFDSTIAAGTTYKIKVEKQNDTIRVYRDNALQATVRDSAFSGGKVGFGSRNNAATFDNLIVE